MKHSGKIILSMLSVGIVLAFSGLPFHNAPISIAGLAIFTLGLVVFLILCIEVIEEN